MMKSSLIIFFSILLIKLVESNVTDTQNRSERLTYLPQRSNNNRYFNELPIFSQPGRRGGQVLQQRPQFPRDPGQNFPQSGYPSSGYPQYPGTNYDPDDNRNAPPVFRSNPGDTSYTISEARLKKIRSQFLYWFYDKGGDDDNGDYQIHINPTIPQVHKNFNFQLPFFGFRFNYTRVSLNGYLEFSDQPDQLMYPLSFPVKDWPKKNDPAFIGIFFSKCRIGSIRDTDVDQRRSGVYFRMERDLMSRTDPFGTEVRERLMWDIREGMIGANNFIPKHAAIITWKNVTFSGGIEDALYKTNTFQLVLATDEVFTYAIFNYVELQWTTHTEARGDTTGGEGGIPAFVGFNAGNATRSYQYLPYSQMSTIRDLTGRGWVNGFPGRHIFRIDENILPGNCNKDIAGSTLPLSFAPESGNMLGGTIVNITGPCFTPQMKIRCRFDIEEVSGIVVDTNRAICVQPFVMAEGYILFDISIDGGKYDWKGQYFIETPATALRRINFENDKVHEKYPNEIRISWDSFNLTTNLETTLQISLWGYREISIRPELVYIDLLEGTARNNGNYTIIPSTYKDRNNYLQNDISFGFIQINCTVPVSDGGPALSPILWSQPIPLGWYFAPQWERIWGKNWPEYTCDEWLKNDRYLKNFAHEISQCPCTLEQAMADKGRFLPDAFCDIDTNPNCFYNKGARHCVRTGAPSLEGSEQQCCYDKNNMLMLSYDQQWGSKPRRASNIGFLPWNEANKVPTLSQWYHDISSFYHCCLWQEEQSVGCETYRFERRPSQDCVGYQAPAIGTVFGDPHVITFDGLEYTFNGKGEFVLVHTDMSKYQLDIQARFEQLPKNLYGEVGATVLTSIAAQDNSSTIIEVRLRPDYAQWRYRLDVFANKKRVFFDRPSLRHQHFRGVTVYQPSYVLNQSEVIVMFPSGVGVEVLENKGYMAARVYMPWTLINQTRGLLGNWTSDRSDDLILPDGTSFSVGTLNDFESIHRGFGIKWLLEDKVDPRKGPSLFLHEYGRSSSYYSNITFLPVFKRRPSDILPSNRTKDMIIAEAMCGESYQCKYDYAVSMNRDMAYYTLMYFSSYSEMKKTTSDRVISCGILETPRFGRKSNFFFTPGKKVTFECNQGFVLVGDSRRECTSKGIWSFPEYGFTECLRQVEYDLQQLAKTAFIIVGVLLPLVLLLVCVGRCIWRNNKKNDNSTTSWRYVVNPSSSLRRKRLGSGVNLNESDSDKRSPRLYQNPNLLNKNLNLNNNSSSTNRLFNKKKKRTYDGVYVTNEPVPGMPLIDFDDDDKEIWKDKEAEDDFTSTTNTNSTFSSPFSLHKDPIPDEESKKLTTEPNKRHGSIETDIF